MALLGKGGIKWSRVAASQTCKRAIKLLLYAAVGVIVVQVVTYRTYQSANVIHQNGPHIIASTDHHVTARPVTQRTVSTSTWPWEQLQETRRRGIRSHCPQQNPLSLQQVLGQKHFSDYDFMDLAIVDDVHRLIYCGAPKVATTNWKRVFLILGGKAQADLQDLNRFNPHDMRQFKTLAQYSPEERKRLIATYRTFLFVRHPFNRLDSAYYDRLRYDPNVVLDENFQQLIGTEIIRRYRNPNITTADSLRRGHDVRFSELVQYLTDESNPVRMANGHFAPISSLCFPCQVDYDYIGKYETLLEDARNILSTVNVSMPFIFPPTTNKNSKTSDRWAMDMRSLNPEQHQALYREYRQDFELFDYDPDDWRKF